MEKNLTSSWIIIWVDIFWCIHVILQHGIKSKNSLVDEYFTWKDVSSILIEKKARGQ